MIIENFIFYSTIAFILAVIVFTDVLKLRRGTNILLALIALVLFGTLSFASFVFEEDYCFLTSTDEVLCYTSYFANPAIAIINFMMFVFLLIYTLVQTFYLFKGV